ncbi:arylsulfatase B-like isoform X2 [Arctopsyche grandis]
MGSRSVACVLVIAALIARLGDAISTSTGQPHIIFILADDMGWNDVGFHGSNQIPTPNIDALCYNGVILNNYYAQPVCTPSRAALLTGKYPIRTGMQGSPLNNLDPAGLPLNEKLLPEYLRDLGYTTHAIGKWHLGMARTTQLPTYRGFDSHFGYRGGYTSYYDYVLQQSTDNEDLFGFDLYRNLTASWSDVGTYATDLYTREAVSMINDHDPRVPLFMYLAHLATHAGNEGKPLEAPQETVQKMAHVVDANRRTYAAMVSKLDESVGKVVQALKNHQMLDNSIIIFQSDNGAPMVGEYKNWGSNWPLRGMKDTMWEGGVKVPACMWNNQLRGAPRVSYDLMHITDWLPTLVTAAGGFSTSLPYDTDGLDQWSSLLDNTLSARSEVLLNIDEKKRTAGFRRGSWKLVIGQSGNGDYDHYFGEDGTRNIRFVAYDFYGISNSDVSRALSTVSRITTQHEMAVLRDSATVRCSWRNVSTCETAPGKSCLFDMDSDPCEQRDLSRIYPHIVREMKRSLVYYKGRLVPQKPRKQDYRANPSRFNYTYHPWLDHCLVNCDT